MRGVLEVRCVIGLYEVLEGCNNWCTYVNCSWHDSVHIRTLPPYVFILIRHSRFVERYLELPRFLL